MSRLPLIFVVFAFAVSRAIAYALGVWFNAGPLRCFFQIVDPELLRTRLLESLFYLHSQPPLFNLLLGVVLKLFPAHFAAAMHGVYLVLGLTLSVALYLLLVRLGIRSWPSAVIAAALSATPAFILYENWLFYEYPVAALLILSALALHEFLRQGTVRTGVAFFTLLAVLIYVRTTFQILWLLLVVGLLLVVRRDLRRRILAASAVPMLVVVLLLVKNLIVFGVPATSSWFGMYIAQLVDTKVPLSERKKLVDGGELSRVSLATPFSSPAAYLPLVRRPRPRHVPVLDQLKKSTGCWNMNNSVFVPASRDYFSDAITLIRRHPGAYARAIIKDEPTYLRPATEGGYFDRSKYLTVFDRVVLLQRGPGKPSWTILLAHLVALLYGLRLIYRLVRRRLAPTASAVTLAFVWLTFAYVIVVATFTQVFEKNRIRFSLDALVVVLLSAAARDALPRVRERVRARRSARRQV
jgi:hypothetical protein